ncbi:FMN-binding protein [Nocardioides flavescens]|uniref:FMN-binding protein n=1 Tax=Nocardioides flavescens TaxID=2691959 RepID=A0A6L7EYL0_9ACTN|nr:FMN-binding protein [Nocardioides flavescens]MXG89289.1 FMN-binding protein [Nocardioides flavescens]
MKRIVLSLLSTLSAVVLLFGYRTSTSGPDLAATTGSSTTQTLVRSGGTTTTGDVAQTRWGPVQVQISTDADGTITDVQVVQYPDGNHEDQEINAYALPVLVDATLAAQSADIDMVSGATITSEGYVQSLQSALDQAPA